MLRVTQPESPGTGFPFWSIYKTVLHPTDPAALRLYLRNMKLTSVLVSSREEGGEVTEKGYLGASNLFLDLDLGCSYK